MEKKEALYQEFAKYYDLIYKDKKYDVETKFINDLVKKNVVQGRTFLNVACGTGSHDKILVKNGYDVFGIDKNEGMLKIARKKVPQAKYKQGDMRNFSLNKKFDIIACLFTSLNYNPSRKDFLKTVRNFKRHLKDDGIMILDCPLFISGEDRQSSEMLDTKDGKIFVLYDFVEKGNLKLDITLYWQIPKGKKYEVVKDRHCLQGYTLAEYQEIVRKAGLNHKVYWNYSLTKKKGTRPLLVCTKKRS